MPTNVFISRPTKIERSFEAHYAAFDAYLKRARYKTHRLGPDCSSIQAPLKSVMALMRTCQAAIILGYPQYEVTAALTKAASPEQQISAMFPTPWNHIEAALAFRQRIPVLVIAHEGVSGGIFDHGVTGEYVHTMKLDRKDWHRDKGFQGILNEWKKAIK